MEIADRTVVQPARSAERASRKFLHPRFAAGEIPLSFLVTTGHVEIPEDPSTYVSAHQSRVRAASGQRVSFTTYRGGTQIVCAAIRDYLIARPEAIVRVVNYADNVQWFLRTAILRELVHAWAMADRFK